MGRETKLLILLGIVAYFGIIKQQSSINAVSTLIDTTGNIMADLNRGERINNPFNIRISANPWQGLAPEQPDNAFAAFIDPQHGIRAGIEILKTYYNKYGLNTIEAIISRYAPPSENDTLSYIAAVAQALGVSPYAPLTLDSSTLFTMAKAIIKHEQGRVIYDDSVIEQGIQIA